MSGKMPVDVLERFNNWFQARVRNGCPFCDARDWTVHDELAATSSVESDTHAIDPGHGAALVQITCNECAFTATFSAVRIGLLEPDER